MVTVIPLTTDPDQTFTVTVPLNNKNIDLMFRLRYNTEAKYWCLSITDASEMLIDSMPLLTGNYPASNLLEQYDYFGIGMAMILKNGNLSTENPDDTNLGTDFVLVWGDPNG